MSRYNGIHYCAVMVKGFYRDGNIIYYMEKNEM